MKIYLKNKTTQKISLIESESFLTLSKGIRDLNDEATTQEIDNFTMEQERDKKITICQSYLASSDWYVSREIDEPNTYPQGVKDNRIEARSKINALEACATIAEVNNINVNFS